MACRQHVAYSAGVGSDAGGMPVVWLVFDVDGAAQPSNRVFHRLQIADLTPSRLNDANRGVRGRGSRGAWSIRLRGTEDRLCEHVAEPCSVGGYPPTVAGDLQVGLHADEHRGGLDDFVERHVFTQPSAVAIDSEDSSYL